MERVTTGSVLLAAGRVDEAEDALHAALGGAEDGRLPQQIQRAVRAATTGRLREVVQEGLAALERVRLATGTVAAPAPPRA